jgi:hypothetical protein
VVHCQKHDGQLRFSKRYHTAAKLAAFPAPATAPRGSQPMHEFVERTAAAKAFDPAPNEPSFISRVCSPYALPLGGLQKLLE